VRAVVCPAYGPPDAVRVEERPVPSPVAGEALVRVHAAAVNFPDVLMVANQYQISVPAPFIPGSEFAGVIEEVNGATGDFVVGDRVTWVGLNGAFAEQAVVPVGGLSRISAGVDDHTAAAFGVAYRTAYHTLRSVALITPGDALVVLGAGGGVGLAAVQLGVQLGASVTAVASSDEKLAIAASYGASHVINHRSGDVRGALREALNDGADAVVDPVGGELSEPALRSLRRGGRFVTVGYASGVIPRIPLNLVLMKGVSVWGFHIQDVSPGELTRNEKELNALLAERRVLPHVGAIYPLEAAADALRLVADGAAIGKVLIEMS
jgi:NADPH:quinone reductase